jgi:hypothetical protein
MNDVLKTVLDYIKENHPDAAGSLVDTGYFTVSSDSKRVLGNRRSIYSGSGWNISIGHPVIPEIVYNIKAVYNNGEIIWSGRILNGKVEEQCYENIIPG